MDSLTILKLGWLATAVCIVAAIVVLVISHADTTGTVISGLITLAGVLIQGTATSMATHNVSVTLDQHVDDHGTQATPSTH
jgi:hypothetical protein